MRLVKAGPETASTARSSALFERARRLMPGGVNSPVRAFAAVGGEPRFIDRAEGPYLWDVDGNRYIDCVMSWGPLIHGHAFPPVVEAITRMAARGTSFGAPSATEVELAGAITAAMPAVPMVRFVNSGTEAAMSAIRLARAATGRDVIVKFAGNYHGHVDALLARAGSGGLTFGVPTSPGVPAAVATETLVAEYNDVGALHGLFAAHGAGIAAVVVEPVAGNMGVTPPTPGFLEAIRTLTTRHGALFLCDEVITGFRVGPSGAQGRFGLQPDLTILGKIIGGGLPVGAYGGRHNLMSLVAPAGPVYQAGTLAGNPVAMAAGLANLRPLQDPTFYDRLDGTTAVLADGLRRRFRAAGLEVTINAVTGMLTVFFGPGPIATLADVERTDRSRYARFFHAMLRRGVYLPPSAFEAWMLSAAHTTEIVECILEAATGACEEVSSSSSP